MSLRSKARAATSAAARPDLMAPSIVAGKPVVGPVARERQIGGQAVRAPGRRRLLLRRGGEGGPLLLHHAIRRHGLLELEPPVPARPPHSATPAAAIAAAGSSTMLFAALMVTETWPGLTNTHSAAPEVRPMNPASAHGPSGIGLMQEMDVQDGLERSGATSPGNRSAATQGGTASTHRIVRDRARSGPSGPRSAVIRPSSIVRSGDPAVEAGCRRRAPARWRWPGRSAPPTSPSFGSIGRHALAAAQQGLAHHRGEQAGEPFLGGVLSAATATAPASRQYSRPRRMLSATVVSSRMRAIRAMAR